MYNPVKEDQQTYNKLFPPVLLPIIIKNRIGNKLLGTVFIADGKGPHKTILLLHGFPGNENNYDLAHALRRAGYNVVIFHYSGSWGSEGDFSFAQCRIDVEDVLEYLSIEQNVKEFRTCTDEVFLVGHCLGGWLALSQMYNCIQIKSVCAISPFNTNSFLDQIKRSEAGRLKLLNILNKGAEFLTGCNGGELFEEIINLNKSKEIHFDSNIKKVLLTGATLDFITPIDSHYNEWSDELELNKNINLTKLEFETGHVYSNKRIMLAESIIEWLKKDG